VLCAGAVHEVALEIQDHDFVTGSVGRNKLKH